MTDDALFRAAQRGDLDETRRLLEQMLKQSAPVSVFRQAMRVAIWNDHEDIVCKIVCLAGHLLRRCDPFQSDTWAVTLAARLDSTAAANVLIQCSKGTLPGVPDSHAHNCDFGTAFSCAADNGNAATLLLLIPHVTSIEWRNAALASAVHIGHARTIRTLLKCGVNVNARDWFGIPLHTAALSGQTRVVAQLLHFKANVHARTKYGATALALANAEGYASTAAVLRRFAGKATKPGRRKVKACHLFLRA